MLKFRFQTKFENRLNAKTKVLRSSVSDDDNVFRYDSCH